MMVKIYGSPHIWVFPYPIKVVKDSAAERAGLRLKDVVVQCNEKIIGSTLDLFDKICDKVGETTKLSVLRKTGHVTVNVKVEDVARANYYRWSVPDWGSGVDSPHDSEVPDSSLSE